MNKLYLISIITTLFICSCSSYRFIDIQVINPSIVNVPKIEKLYMVDFRPVNGKYTKAYFSDSIAVGIYNTIMVQLFDSLNYLLKDSPAFENTDISVIKDDSLQKGVDGEYKLKVRLKLYVDTTYAKRVLYGSWGEYIIYYKFQFQLVNMYNNAQADWYQFSGSTVWRKSKYYEDVSEGVKKISRIAALRFAERIAPYWITEERKFFYSPNKLMRSGYQKLVENNLEGARSDWERLVNVGTSKLSSMAAYNVALVCEMQDKLDEAEGWLIKSNQIKTRPETNNYLKTIRNRKLSRIMLEKQMQ